MSVAYSDFFASGIKNASVRSKSRFSTMSLDIPMNNVLADCSRTSSPIMESPILHPETAMDALESEATPTGAATAKGGQGRLLRKRRSSLSLAAGAQGNASAIKGPTRAVQVSRARSGSTASITSHAEATINRAGRSRSGSIGSVLKSSKRRSMKLGLAPPLPPPKSPLPDLPSFQATWSEVPGTAPADITSFSIPAVRSPLATRPFQYSPLPTPSFHSDALKSSPIREGFDFRMTNDAEMKEN